jgi:hypothetical protein
MTRANAPEMRLDGVIPGSCSAKTTCSPDLRVDCLRDLSAKNSPERRHIYYVQDTIKAVPRYQLNQCLFRLHR